MSCCGAVFKKDLDDLFNIFLRVVSPEFDKKKKKNGLIHELSAREKYQEDEISVFIERKDVFYSEGHPIAERFYRDNVLVEEMERIYSEGKLIFEANTIFVNDIKIIRTINYETEEECFDRTLRY